MDIKIAIAHVADSRPDFYATRKDKVEEELAQMEWIREQFQTIESGIIQSKQAASEFAQKASGFGAQSLIIHIPIWADPVLSMAIMNHISLPVMLIGNSRPETSSLVGLLGAGGALDQTGHRHIRVFDQSGESGKKSITAFAKAAATKQSLSGQVLGLFGGRSLGIFTAVADPAQWQTTFGVDIETVDQLDIVREAEETDNQVVARHVEWLVGRLKDVRFNNHFTPKNLERQVRSYLAMNSLIEKYGFDFVGVKCQTELSDGYVSQCVAHMLLNGDHDLNGPKDPFVHACESDADGALTMQILKMLSGNKATALMDLRWFDSDHNLMVLANCGAVSASFNATQKDTTGLSDVSMVPHAFGTGGGGALPFQVSPQEVTLARLCRKDGEYWMAIVPGTVTDGHGYETLHTTPEFPKAFVSVNLNENFWQTFGSNHLHMVTGDEVDSLIAFCRLTGIRYELWR